ncbi:hypothetical protein SAMD00019534_067070 [Acytostelium subglobosum LB1]|uniref:hypothetical protein n=1 Tax=Acytostelium subglobosum LB1 TaxID=1410327 RepID=UPI000644E043|nr:hypothetical protein SAMD00019534_067070 [Acytostelium subglobosum LB1]GAM23532.1 hypothetical protein SAMD00019534_067070 [Acytostelium subglobosum LB1]|eukprot:XP_012753273.1 hypothetical protein SAMD00019534_067070 [Acytostelium subglobosum LB1]
MNVVDGDTTMVVDSTDSNNNGMTTTTTSNNNNNTSNAMTQTPTANMNATAITSTTTTTTNTNVPSTTTTAITPVQQPHTKVSDSSYLPNIDPNAFKTSNNRLGFNTFFQHNMIKSLRLFKRADSSHNRSSSATVPDLIDDDDVDVDDDDDDDDPILSIDNFVRKQHRRGASKDHVAPQDHDDYEDDDIEDLDDDEDDDDEDMDDEDDEVYEDEVSHSLSSSGNDPDHSRSYSLFGSDNSPHFFKNIIHPVSELNAYSLAHSERLSSSGGFFQQRHITSPIMAAPTTSATPPIFPKSYGPFSPPQPSPLSQQQQPATPPLSSFSSQYDSQMQSLPAESRYFIITYLNQGFSLEQCLYALLASNHDHTKASQWLLRLKQNFFNNWHSFSPGFNQADMSAGGYAPASNSPPLMTGAGNEHLSPPQQQQQPSFPATMPPSFTAHGYEELMNVTGGASTSPPYHINQSQQQQTSPPPPQPQQQQPSPQPRQQSGSSSTKTAKTKQSHTMLTTTTTTTTTLTMAESDSQIKEANRLYTLGIQHLKQKDYEKALNCFDKSYETNPTTQSKNKVFELANLIIKNKATSEQTSGTTSQQNQAMLQYQESKLKLESSDAVAAATAALEAKEKQQQASLAQQQLQQQQLQKQQQQQLQQQQQQQQQANAKEPKKTTKSSSREDKVAQVKAPEPEEVEDTLGDGEPLSQQQKIANEEAKERRLAKAKRKEEKFREKEERRQREFMEQRLKQEENERELLRRIELEQIEKEQREKEERESRRQAEIERLEREKRMEIERLENEREMEQRLLLEKKQKEDKEKREIEKRRQIREKRKEEQLRLQNEIEKQRMEREKERERELEREREQRQKSKPKRTKQQKSQSGENKNDDLDEIPDLISDDDDDIQAVTAKIISVVEKAAASGKGTQSIVPPPQVLASTGNNDQKSTKSERQMKTSRERGGVTGSMSPSNVPMAVMSNATAATTTTTTTTTTKKKSRSKDRPDLFDEIPDLINDDIEYSIRPRKALLTRHPVTNPQQNNPWSGIISVIWWVIKMFTLPLMSILVKIFFGFNYKYCKCCDSFHDMTPVPGFVWGEGNRVYFLGHDLKREDVSSYVDIENLREFDNNQQTKKKQQ